MNILPNPTGTASLFEEFPAISVPPTQGIKYAGSKLKLLLPILERIERIKPRTILDGFSGSTRVSQALAQNGYDVISNDISVWSEVFASCFLLNSCLPHEYESLIEHLNAVPEREGWFTQYYGGDPDLPVTRKFPWQKHNTRKLDGIRQEIEDLNLSPHERSVALSSLILALDEVDNTLGHFASYLNGWSARSFRSLHLKVPRLFLSSGNHQVHRQNIFSLLPNVEADMAYFDPPYGSNNEKMPPSRVRYSAYYHVWTSVCLFDTPPVFGKANRRSDTSDTQASSVFEEFRRDEAGKFLAVKAVERMLQEVQAPFILLSYSSGGRATAEELQDVIASQGKLLEIVAFDYKRNVMSGMRWTHEWVKQSEEVNQEFLFLIEKA